LFNFYSMKRIAAGAALGALLVVGSLHTAMAQDPPKKEYKPGEFELYSAVIADLNAKNFAKVLTDVDTWKQKIPQSDYANDRDVLVVQALGETKQFDKALSAAAPLVNQDLDKLFPDPASGPGQVLTVLATACTAIQQIAAPTPDQIATADKAAHKLENYDRAPQGIAPAAWSQAKTQLQGLAKGALLYMVVAPATAALNKGDCEAAQTAFSKALSDNPQNSFLSYQLGQAYMCTVKKTPARNDEVRPKAIYEFIRTLVIDPTAGGIQPDANKMKGILEGTYVNYHGGSDGLEELKAQAKANPLPPANFSIESATVVSAKKQAQFESQYPQLAMWLKIKGALAGAEGPQYFEGQLKNAAVPKMRGTVIEGKPACRSKELIVAVPEPNQTNAQSVITLKLDAAIAGKPEAGEIQWEGVPSAFTPEPFMLTMDTEKAKIEGLKTTPCGAAPAARPGVKKGGTTKKK
jgi:tetratricopeptide (TPR) repeat protein